MRRQRSADESLSAPEGVEFAMRLDEFDAAQLMAQATAMGMTPEELAARLVRREVQMIADHAVRGGDDV